MDRNALKPTLKWRRPRFEAEEGFCLVEKFSSQHHPNLNFLFGPHSVF